MTATTIEKPTQAEVTPAERTSSRPTFRPNVDIIELEEELLVLADMPGATADDVDIQFENGMLTIFGTVRERNSSAPRQIVQEYGVGDFLRTFKIGESIDTERISADYRDGVLTLHLPKTEKVKPRKIAVKTK